jgi:hypothetical protein
MTGRDEPLACLWQVEDRDYNIGIVGFGSGLNSLLEIIRDERYREFMPGLHLVALAEPDHNLSKVDPGRARDQVYPSCEQCSRPSRDRPSWWSWRQAFPAQEAARHPARARLPNTQHTAAVFLWRPHSLHQMGAQCEMHLNRQRA